MVRLLTSLLFSVLFTNLMIAQGVLAFQEDERGTIFRDFRKETEIKESRDLILEKLVSDGYYFAGIDSLRTIQDTILFKITRGSLVLKSSDILARKKLRRKALDKYVNEGYPFAKILFDSIFYREDGSMDAKWKVDQGPKILWDSLSITGTVPVSRDFLYSALNFKPGEPFSEKKYQESSTRIDRINQTALTAPTDIGFSKGKAILYLRLEDRQADSFEGILGLLNDENEQSVVTGYLNLDLTNLFRSGKEFHFNWNRFAPSSQELMLNYTHPFFLSSNMTLATDFSLFRQDSLFVRRNFGLTFNFPITSYISFGLNLTNKTSDILGAVAMPENGLDYRVNEYRPSILIGNYRETPGPETIFSASMSFGFGDKEIRRNALFDQEVYDTTQINSSNYQYDVEILAQLRLSQSSSLFSGIELGSIRGLQIVNNELYRLGGLKNLRGFNENEFFVQQFLKAQTEYRLFFDRYSYLMALIDVALIQQNLDKERIARSFGGGINFNTENGDFQLIFAVGSIGSSQLNFQDMKVHFGYSILF